MLKLLCEGCGANRGQASVPLTETIPVEVGLANGAFKFRAFCAAKVAALLALLISQ